MNSRFFSFILFLALCCLPLSSVAQALYYGTDPNGFVVLFQGDALERLNTTKVKYEGRNKDFLEVSYEAFKKQDSEAQRFYQDRLSQFKAGQDSLVLDSESFKSQSFSVYQLCAVLLDDLAFRYALDDSSTDLRSILLYELAVLYSHEKSLEYALVFWQECIREGGILSVKAQVELEKAKGLIAKNSVSLKKVGAWESFIFRGGAWVIAVFIAVLLTFIFLMKAGKPGFDDLLEDNRREEQKALLEKVSGETGSL